LAVLCIAEAPRTLADNTLEENTWKGLPEQEKNHVLGCATVNGIIYTLCFYDFSGENNIGTIYIYIYDPKTDVWSTCATKVSTADRPLNWELIDVATVVIGEKIYCFGHGIYYESILNNKVYDTSTNHWSNINPSQSSRERPSVCVVDGMIYLVGGQTYKGISEVNPRFRAMEPTNIVETYDPATGIWETKRSLNKPVTDPMVIAVEDKIYVFGAGYIQIYNTKTDQWTTIGDQNGDQRLNDGDATSGRYALQKIYLFGQDEVYVFDPETNTYTDNISYPEYKSEQYPNVTFGHYRTSKVAVVDDVFYLIGGGVIGTLEKQWTTSEGKIKKSSEPISIAFDYRYVPLDYSVPSQSDKNAKDGLSLVFTLAGIAVAAAIVTATGALVYRFRRTSTKAS
jgi:hypothetical protein